MQKNAVIFDYLEEQLEENTSFLLLAEMEGFRNYREWKQWE